MKNKIMFLLAIFVIMILITGCTEKPEKELTDNRTAKNDTETIKAENNDSRSNPPEFVSVEEVITRCINECKSRKDNEDFGNGPCLSNEIAPEWVCDIAHAPREEIDNKPENQCSFYREGKAHHFVELDINCSIIKVF